MIVEMYMEEINLLKEEKQMLSDLIMMQSAKIDEQSIMIADYESLLNKLNGYVKQLKECLDDQQPIKVLYKAVHIDDAE